MPQIINTNIASLNAQRNLNNSQNAQSQALERLSSGLRINGAKDDAAGLAISNRLDAQVRGLNVANRNAGDGVSLAQTAEGALNSITASLQRMRELALQAANGSNSALERSSIQEEVEQLKAEIGSISDKTNFNGQKLLDGSFQNTSFQTGANGGEKIDVSIGETSISTLGSAVSAGITGNMANTAVAANAVAGADSALVAGDLVINGIAVGASAGSNDGSSNALKASSAISKAAAINAVSDLSGVTATVNVNTVEGTNIVNTTANTDDFSINGVLIVVDTATTTTPAGALAELNKVADAINAKEGATGVSASVVSTSTGNRIDLTALDGRNIDILESAAGSAAAKGIAAGAITNASTYLGNVTLSSKDGSDISLETTTGNIDNAGFEEGTFSGVRAGVVGDAGLVAGRAALAAGDLTINGVGIGVTFAKDDTASTGSEAISSIALAASINRASEQTGVTAKANANTVNSIAVVAGAVNADVTINGVSISVATGANVSEQLTNVMAAINDVSGQSGVRAEVLDGDQFQLVADDGRNIIVAGTVANSGLVVGTNIGSVTLEAAGQFTLGSETGNIENAGLNVGTYGGSESGTLLKDIDVSTVKGAEAALVGIDNAINQVASEQAKLGAVQNRFESTISNNAVNSESLAAATSRIRDADFAVETAALSRSQVLQQAGISVLAQANARPQQVLSLLQ